MPGHPVRVPVIGICKEESISCRTNIPNLQITGGGHHLTVIIVGKIPVNIFIKIVHTAPFQQPGLVGLSLG